MFSEMIACKLIDWPDNDSKERTRNKGDFVKGLAQSIEMEGQHQPIVLRPNAAKPGRYLGVMGWHRHHAIAKILKREAIEARVIVDMDDTDAEMATISENLYRSPLKKAQQYTVLRKWHEHYTAKYPHMVGKRTGQELADIREAARADRAAAADATTKPGNGLVVDGQEAPAAKPAVPVLNFPAMVSRATGEGLSQTKKKVKIATTFNPDQIEVFEQMQVSTSDQYAISKITDQARRDEVVNRVARCMEAKEAIASVTPPKASGIKPGDGEVVEAAAPATAPETDAPAVPDEAEMSDAQWLEVSCCDIRKLLPEVGRARFDIEALTYRATRGAKNAFRVATKGAIKGLPAGPKGSYAKAVMRVVNVAHPRDWRRCGTCLGHGANGGYKCRACYGEGFILKVKGR